MFEMTAFSFLVCQLLVNCTVRYLFASSLRGCLSKKEVSQFELFYSLACICPLSTIRII
jgi:hypothetical protein